MEDVSVLADGRTLPLWQRAAPVPFDSVAAEHSSVAVGSGSSLGFAMSSPEIRSEAVPRSFGAAECCRVRSRKLEVGYTAAALEMPVLVRACVAVPGTDMTAAHPMLDHLGCC